MKRPMNSVAKYSLAVLVLCAPLAAQAMEGWVVDDISLQAGPDPAYPSIIELAAGTPVSIQGCINGWTWCDVVVGGDRGWVPGTFLEEDYSGQRVVVIDYGPRIGIPVVGFSLGLYWDQHYHSRPFYTQREQWVTKSIQPSQPPRPAKAVARTTAQPKSGAAPAQSSTAQQTRVQEQARAQHQAAPMTAQQSKVQSSSQKQTMAARAKAPRRPESAPLPEAGKQPSPAEKRESAPEQTTVAKAKPRSGEPKPKDELKKPKPKDKQDQGGGSEGGR
jgi:uncharacterized protein YraI